MEATWKEAQASVAAARAALETARINLNYTKVKAPISGRIGKSKVTKGALMTAQQAEAMAVIQQIDPLYVDVNAPANELLALRAKLESSGANAAASAPASVQVLMADGAPLEQQGTMEFSDITVDQGTGTVSIRATVPNQERKLLPGMFIRARLTSPHEMPTIMVPLAALTRTQRGEQIGRAHV